MLRPRQCGLCWPSLRIGRCAGPQSCSPSYTDLSGNVSFPAVQPALLCRVRCKVMNVLCHQHPPTSSLLLVCYILSFVYCACDAPGVLALQRPGGADIMAQWWQDPACMPCSPCPAVARVQTRPRMCRLASPPLQCVGLGQRSEALLRRRLPARFFTAPTIFAHGLWRVGHLSRAVGKPVFIKLPFPCLSSR